MTALNDEWLDEFKARKLPAQPTTRQGQVIIVIDSAGNLIVEAPGKNGMREKIEGVSLGDLPLAIQTSLRAQQATTPKSIKSNTTREDPTVIRERRIEAARKAHAEEWQRRFDAASIEEQQLMLFKRHQAALKREADEKARAGDIWKGIVQDHKTSIGPNAAIALANRVISDPTRRPRIRIEVGNKLISPRLVGATAIPQNASGKTRKPKITAVPGGKVLKL